MALRVGASGDVGYRAAVRCGALSVESRARSAKESRAIQLIIEANRELARCRALRNSAGLDRRPGIVTVRAGVRKVSARDERIEAAAHRFDLFRGQQLFQRADK